MDNIQELLSIFRRGYDDELCNNDKETFPTKIQNIAYELGTMYAFNDEYIPSDIEILKEITKQHHEKR